VTTDNETITGVQPDREPFDLEESFRANYARVARVIDGVLRDPSRSEELAVEVFLKLWKTSSAQGSCTEGWLYRAAIRRALDEVRRRQRQQRRERLLRFVGFAATPEDVRSSNESQHRVRIVLAAMQPRQAELLLLRNLGLSYEELAAALTITATSVGTFLSRAQRTFRKEYTDRYGEQY
jgi:RNA polymerase sigma-70 factor (ECF subfamily)